jgi:hypothetical protein
MDLDKEFKKLNYALKSYKCDYHADYEEDANTGKVLLLLLDSGELPIIEQTASYGDEFQNEIKAFKKVAISTCSHA